MAKLSLVYVFPNMEIEKYGRLARRFADSYMEFAPGQSDHDIHVVINGDRMNGAGKYFDPLPVTFHQHNNWAKDLGAFMLAAQTVDCELMVMAGSYVHFHRAGWLGMIDAAFDRYGPAVGGAWAFQVPEPHIRTTLFWSPPELIASYPHLLSGDDRYFFEHGRDSIALWSGRLGFEPYQLTWRGVFGKKDWHAVTLEETLALDQHTKRDLGK